MLEEIDVNMIEDSVTVHDKFQFEIKWAYKFYKEKKFTTYNIETYFFIPQNLGINKATYTNRNFYNDLKTYIRFKTPTVLLQNIANGTACLIKNLKEIFQKTVDENDKRQFIEYENSIKLFCCTLKSSLRDHVMFIEKIENPGDIGFLIDQYIEYTGQIALEYRELRKILNVPSMNKNQFSKYLFGDEFMSLAIEDYTYKLLNILEKAEMNETGCGYKDRLLDITRKEIEYRKNSNYPSIAQMDKDNEVLVFRKSILKKYMGSSLFLDIRTENDGKYLEQIIFGAAAGLSMVFATAIAFLSQKSYGNLSLPFFVALVISYMFKDRIKEILRIYFSGKLGRILYNYKTYINTRNHRKVGWCKEHFSFINEPEISEEILKLRNKDHITEIENDSMGEQVILYKKQIRLYTNDFINVGTIGMVDGITDIMRFNVQKFLAKMDNPMKPMFTVFEDTYKKIFVKRVYHLNLIIKYSFEDMAVFKRFRIILNRKGIKSIEMVEC